MNNETYYIKISGSANIPEPLIIDTNYLISTNCSITSSTTSTNDDGTFSVTYKAVPITCEVLKSNGEIVRAKDPRRNSQKIRNFLFKEYANEGFTEDFDSVYDAFTLEVMLLTPQLLRAAIKRLNK